MTGVESKSDQLLVAVEEGIATVTLNRPYVYNALSYELIHMLHEALAGLASDPAIKVVVLTGAGRAFCAGGDINDMRSRPAVGLDPARLKEDVTWVRAGMESSRLLHEMPKPTLAVMPGAAAGAGLALALACDMRIAAQDAKFTTAFAKIGLSSDFGASFFLTHILGAAKARELLFLSETIAAEHAAEIGMVNLVVPREALEAEAAQCARKLAAAPGLAIELMKANLRAAQHSSLSETLDLEAHNLVKTLGHEQFQANVRRFLDEKQA